MRTKRKSVGPKYHASGTLVTPGRPARVDMQLPSAPSPDPANALGKAYASSLRDKAAMLRTGLLLSADVRASLADDIDALAEIAENSPHAFSAIGK